MDCTVEMRVKETMNNVKICGLGSINEFFQAKYVVEVCLSTENAEYKISVLKELRALTGVDVKTAKDFADYFFCNAGSMLYFLVTFEQIANLFVYRSKYGEGREYLDVKVTDKGTFDYNFTLK